MSKAHRRGKCPWEVNGCVSWVWIFSWLRGKRNGLHINSPLKTLLGEKEIEMNAWCKPDSPLKTVLCEDFRRQE